LPIRLLAVLTGTQKKQPCLSMMESAGKTVPPFFRFPLLTDLVAAFADRRQRMYLSSCTGSKTAVGSW